MAQKNTTPNSNGVAKPGGNKGRYSSAKSSWFSLHSSWEVLLKAIEANVMNIIVRMA
jgi:hypothetical protein